MFFVAIIPSAGDVLREADRANTRNKSTRVDLGDRTAQFYAFRVISTTI